MSPIQYRNQALVAA
ncbi:hypothetical protein [Alteromonas sp. CYL-A6]